MIDLHKKKEYIAKVYGEHYEKLKSMIDEDGFLEPSYKGDLFLLFPENQIDVCKKTGIQRLKVLRKVETNNGWNLIQSKEDLPKVEGYYHTINKFDEEVTIYKFNPSSEGDIDFWLNYVIEYQRIQPSKPKKY